MVTFLYALLVTKVRSAAKYRLYPTKPQEKLLAKHFGCVRVESLATAGGSETGKVQEGYAGFLKPLSRKVAVHSK